MSTGHRHDGSHREVGPQPATLEGRLAVMKPASTAKGTLAAQSPPPASARVACSSTPPRAARGELNGAQLSASSPPESGRGASILAPRSSSLLLRPASSTAIYNGDESQRAIGKTSHHAKAAAPAIRGALSVDSLFGSPSAAPIRRGSPLAQSATYLRRLPALSGGLPSPVTRRLVLVKSAIFGAAPTSLDGLKPRDSREVCPATEATAARVLTPVLCPMR